MDGWMGGFGGYQSVLGGSFTLVKNLGSHKLELSRFRLTHINETGNLILGPVVVQRHDEV